MQFVLTAVSDHCAFCAPCDSCKWLLNYYSAVVLCHVHLHDDDIRRWFEATVALRALAQT